MQNPTPNITLANQICLEADLPTLTAQEFERFYSVPPVEHGVNVESPSRALEAEWRPGLLGAMRLAILWHEGAEALAAAELAAGIKGMAAFQEWQDAAPELASAAARLRSLVH